MLVVEPFITAPNQRERETDSWKGSHSEDDIKIRTQHLIEAVELILKPSIMYI